MKVVDIRIDDIYVDNEFNCRGQLTAADVVELAQDIEINGLMNPSTVRPCTDEEKQTYGKKWYLLAGFRRHMAVKSLGDAVLPCSINETVKTEAEALMFNFSENYSRKNLNLLQEAKVITRLCALTKNRTEMSRLTNKSWGWIQPRLELLRLPEDIQQLAAAGVFKPSDIRKIFGARDKGDDDAMYEMARRIQSARKQGKTPPQQTARSKKLETKARRNKTEMQAMMAYIRQAVGNGIATRALAWACGEITSYDFFVDLKVMANREGIQFTVPNKFEEKDPGG